MIIRASGLMQEMQLIIGLPLQSGGKNMSRDAAPQVKPGWINQFSQWVDRFPGPGWGYYVGLGLLLLILQSMFVWFEGGIPVGNFIPAQIFLSAAIAFLLGIIPYFDKRAKFALKNIKPVLAIDDSVLKTLENRLTILPGLKSLAAGVLTLVFVFLTEAIGEGPYQVLSMIDLPVSAGISRAVYLICWWFFGIFIFHTIHQLNVINQIYTNYTKVSLFRMNPLYGFSNLTALTSGCLLVLPYGFLLITPEMSLTNPVIFTIYLLISTTALFTFLLPQLGIHGIQKQEKGRLLDEAYKRYEATVGELHQQVDQEHFEKMGNISTAFNILNMEINNIKKTTTWPWQPETLRWLLTALILPLLMWITQHFIGQLLMP
jgi:hypothetical protein